MNTLPAFPFVVSTGIFFLIIIVLLYELFKRKKYINEIRAVSKKAKGLWKVALQHSANYAAALGLDEHDIKDMETFDKTFDVQIPTGTVRIIATYTCGVDYGDTWRTILQARSKNVSIQKEGGGTSEIGVLQSRQHEYVLRVIMTTKQQATLETD